MYNAGMDKDFIKEKVSLLKMWITFLMAIMVGSTAWLVNNWNDTAASFSVFIIIMVISTGITLSELNRKAYRLVKEMKRAGEIKND